MALDANRLGDAIVAAIEATPRPNPADSGTNFLRVYWRAIAAQIVAEITGHSQVTTATPGAQAGATTLPGTGTVL